MKRTFTGYFRSLDPEAGPPSPERFEEFWQALAAVLKLELQRRGLWEGPPRYLGLAEEEENWTPQALEELTIDCYAFILARLRGLKQHLKVKPNIDGLIRLNIRHFLHEQQKRHDPLGFRVFEVVRSAVQQAVSDGHVEVLEGDPAVGNSTHLAFAAGTSGPQGSEANLGAVVLGWDGELIQRLVTAKGKRRHEAIAGLSASLRELAQAGIESLRFKELVDAVKGSVRTRWQAIWVQGQGDTAFEDADETLHAIVPIVYPETLYEDRESFQKLCACVSEALAQLDENEKTRGYLSTLWSFLRSQAPNPDMNALPSRRKTAEKLGIPRDRLPGLFATLGQLVTACREAHSGRIMAAEGETTRRPMTPKGSKR